jgi:hypothetical protein
VSARERATARAAALVEAQSAAETDLIRGRAAVMLSPREQSCPLNGVLGTHKEAVMES